VSTAGFLETTHVNQRAGEPARRWFTSANLDLVVWIDPGHVPIAFELYLDRKRTERAVTWRPETGLRCALVDDGETQPGKKHKSTPLVGPERCDDIERATVLFRSAAATLPRDVAQFVLNKLQSVQVSAGSGPT